MNFPVQQWLFDVDHYHRMIEAGILREDDRVELLQGVIIRMSPIGLRHAACVDGIYQFLFLLLGDAASLRGQNPLMLNDSSEPQPDVVVLKPRKDRYAGAVPLPVDVLLLVEVADSSINFDRDVKLPLYAKDGIVEVWIVNLNNDQIETYSSPVSGVYQSAQVFRRGESLCPVSFPQHSIRVDDLLG